MAKTKSSISADYLSENLSYEEFREFGKYLRRQAVNKTNDKIKLYKYLLKHWYEVKESDKEPEITSELLQKHIYKKQFNNYDKINTLNGQLVREIKRFLMYEMVEKDATTHDLLWNKILKERGLDERFFSHNQGSTDKIKNAQTSLEAAQHDALYILKNDVTFHRATPKFEAEEQERLNQTEYHLDTAYILRKLQIICEQITRNYIFQTEKHTPGLYLDLEQSIIKNSANQLVQIYLHIIELHDKETFKIYQKIKTKITDEQLNISNTIRMSFVRLMINYCHKMYITKGKDRYLHEVCDLYDYAHQNELLIEDGYMSSKDYLNLVKVTITVNDEWNEEALLKVAKNLQPKYRKDGELLVKAILRFKQKKYDKVPPLLIRGGQWGNLEYEIDAYCLLIRSLYEDADYEELTKELHTFELLINNNETLSEERKQPNRNFINFVRKIAQHKAASTPAPEALASNLLRQPPAYLDWCAAKLAELRA